MDLPDSQPFFTEDYAESQSYLEKRQNNESIEESNVCSQSLLLPPKKLRTLNAADSLTFLKSELVDCSERKESFDPPNKETLSKTNAYSDLRPQKQVMINNKKKPKTSDDEKERSSDTEKEKASDEEKEIESSDTEEEKASDKKKEIVSGNKEEEKTRSVMCNDCIFEKDQDKGNYYFGNLLIGELQFLPPCMRSEAYINILQYIDSLKHKHSNKMND